MKSIPLVIVFLFLVKLAYAQANLGIGASLVPENSVFGLQVRGAYNSTEKIAFSGAFNYYFKKSSNFGVDLDCQFKIFNISDVLVSPFAGVNIRKIVGEVNTALEAGFFVEIPKNSYHLYIEPKIILDANTVIALAGGFYF